MSANEYTDPFKSQPLEPTSPFCQQWASIGLALGVFDGQDVDIGNAYELVRLFDPRLPLHQEWVQIGYKAYCFGCIELFDDNNDVHITALSNSVAGMIGIEYRTDGTDDSVFKTELVSKADRQQIKDVINTVRKSMSELYPDGGISFGFGFYEDLQVYCYKHGYQMQIPTEPEDLDEDEQAPLATNLMHYLRREMVLDKKANEWHARLSVNPEEISAHEQATLFLDIVDDLRGEMARYRETDKWSVLMPDGTRITDEGIIPPKI